MSTGMFLGGYIIKKFKFTLVGIAKFAFFTSSASYLFQLLYFPLICENKSVAGLTLTYDGFVYIPLPQLHNVLTTQWEDCEETGQKTIFRKQFMNSPKMSISWDLKKKSAFIPALRKNCESGDNNVSCRVFTVSAEHFCPHFTDRESEAWSSMPMIQPAVIWHHLTFWHQNT